VIISRLATQPTSSADWLLIIMHDDAVILRRIPVKDVNDREPNPVGARTAFGGHQARNCSCNGNKTSLKGKRDLAILATLLCDRSFCLPWHLVRSRPLCLLDSEGGGRSHAACETPGS
jgi:hypothetical protein